MTNNGAVTLTITKPTSADPELGENYCVEGSILITNGASPGAITLNGVAAGNIIGDQNLTPNETMILSYVIHRYSGNTYKEIYVWAT